MLSGPPASFAASIERLAASSVEHGLVPSRSRRSARRWTTGQSPSEQSSRRSPALQLDVGRRRPRDPRRRTARGSRRCARDAGAPRARSAGPARTCSSTHEWSLVICSQLVVARTGRCGCRRHGATHRLLIVRQQHRRRRGRHAAQIVRPAATSSARRRLARWKALFRRLPSRLSVGSNRKRPGQPDCRRSRSRR